MKIFFIPSWYPSENQKLPGIFFKEQAEALTKLYQDINIGVSAWGQNDDRMLLWAKQPFKSARKLVESVRIKPSKRKLGTNLIEYFTPAFTWSERILSGNMNQIIRANQSNLQRFISDFGRPDLIHAHVGYPAGHIAQVISKNTGIPYVITEQMSPFPHRFFLGKDGKLIQPLQEAYACSQANIAISNALAKKMETHAIPNVQVIPNMVDASVFNPATVRLTNKHFTFFCHGRMVHQKGIDILLVALAQIKADVLLRIGGAGDRLQQYQKKARSLGIDKRVSWLGELDQQQAIEEYQKCNAFALPSRHESMGVVFIEAMACGKPVIGTICGGPEEFINDENGILIPPEDVEALRRAMEQMIWNVDKFDPQKIKQTVLSRFSTEVVCGKIREVYQSVTSSEA